MNYENKNDGFRARLEELIGDEKPFPWATRVGLSPGVFNRMWNEGIIPKGEHLVLIAEKTGCSLDWLVLGKGSRTPGPSAVASEYKPVPQIQPGIDGGVTLQVYVTGGAGDPRELIPSEPIEEIIIPKTFYNPSIVPVKVEGRSMEKTLKDGAVVGVDRADRRVVNGELYAVWLPYQGTVIKRLYVDNKKILLQSDNEEFRSRDVEVDLSEADEHFIQGRVKWVVQVL